MDSITHLAQIELHVGYTAHLVFVNEKYDDVDKSCELFEKYARARLQLEWPDIRVFLVRHPEGSITDIQTATKNIAEPPRTLTMAESAWQILWDLIGPYSRHRVTKPSLRAPANFVAPKPPRATSLMVAIEQEDGSILWLPAEDEKEARQIIRSGFGVART